MVLRVLRLLNKKEGTIYTDSKYAYLVVHIFGKIWEERGFVNSQGKGLIHEALITKTLDALRGPNRIAIVHVKGHQYGISQTIRGNNLADEEAKRAALMVLGSEPLTEKEGGQGTKPRFTKQEEQKLKPMGVSEKNGKWILSDGREVIPRAAALRVVKRYHDKCKTHWGVQALYDHFALNYMCMRAYNVEKRIVGECQSCQRINKHQLREKIKGGREMAHRPFARVQVDFTRLPKVRRFKYLLVLVDHLTYFVEAFPTSRATVQTAVIILYEEIIPQYGIIEMIAFHL